MISKEGLHALARYAPVLEARRFAWGEWKTKASQLPWLEHGDIASAFIADAYRFDWVSSDFNWLKWSRQPEAISLREDTSAVENARAEQLVKLLTCCIRSDRFCEGSLAADYDSGLLARIAVRAQHLVASMK